MGEFFKGSDVLVSSQWVLCTNRDEYDEIWIWRHVVKSKQKETLKRRGEISGKNCRSRFFAPRPWRMLPMRLSAPCSPNTESRMSCTRNSFRLKAYVQKAKKSSSRYLSIQELNARLWRKFSVLIRIKYSVPRRLFQNLVLTVWTLTWGVPI